MDLPIILFQLQPALGGVIYDSETLARLLTLDNVVALKEASFRDKVDKVIIQLIRNLCISPAELTGRSPG